MSTSFEYATSKDWLDIMKNRSKLRMHELIERLGLRAKWSQNKRGKTNFESGLVRDLVTDMGEVVNTLPKEADQLVRYLSEDGSMKEHVEALLEKHGTAIWGRVGDREHLISVGEPGVEEDVYPRDLYIENDEDRELITRLLHWWLGMKAINVILAKDRLERERKKKEENKRARLEMENPHDVSGTPFAALAPSAGAPMLNTNLALAGEHARHMHIYHVENASRGSPMSASMYTPPEASGSPIVPGSNSISHGDAHHYAVVNPNVAHGTPPQNVADGVWDRVAAAGLAGSRHGSISSQPAVHSAPRPGIPASTQAVERRRSSLAHELTQQQVPQEATVAPSSDIRQLKADISRLVSDFSRVSTAGAGWAAGPDSPRNGGSYSGLDEDVLRALRAYIYREETEVVIEEDVLLCKLENAWRYGVRADHKSVVENVPVFIARERALFTWLELKRHLVDLDRAEKRWREEGHTAQEIARRIQQHKTLMAATRELLRGYEDMGQVAGSGADNDELLRQAFVVLAGNKYAVEMRWNSVEFDSVMGWLGNSLEKFRAEEEEDGESVYFVG